MSKYRFSENKEQNAKVIRETVSYLRNTLQTHHFPKCELVDVKVLEEFANKIESGDIA